MPPPSACAPISRAAMRSRHSRLCAASPPSDSTFALAAVRIARRLAAERPLIVAHSGQAPQTVMRARHAH